MRISNAALLSVVSYMSATSAWVVPSVEQLGEISEFRTTENTEAFQSNGDSDSYINTSGDDWEAPVIFSEAFDGRKIVPHKYIVIFKKSVDQTFLNFNKEIINEFQMTELSKLRSSDPTNQFFVTTESIDGVSNHGGVVESFHIESSSISGLSGYFLKSTIDMIKRMPEVEFIEQDSIVTINELQTQRGAPWGLARISHRSPLNLGSFNKYLYESNGGEDVISYIIDTGINEGHVEFEGRAQLLADIPNDGGSSDPNGHGTHCSGTIGSKTYGVAKKVQLRGIKVMGSNGSGTMSDVVKGVEVAIKDYLLQMKSKKIKGASANMSLGGGKSPALDMMVNAGVKAGLSFAVAAGNESKDACNSSPASAESAITVGASTVSDARAYFSNWGTCVDIFAPGLNILSTYIGSDTSIATLSGTSMASPHVAGLLAYYISLAPSKESEFGFVSNVTPAQLKKSLISFSSHGVLKDVGEGSPNVLAFNGAGEDLADFWNVGADSQKSPLQRMEDAAENVLHDIGAISRELIGHLF